jgi:glucose uptake protein
MSGIIYAIITVLAWGTWLAPSQNVPFKNQQIKTFYVALANLVLAFLVAIGQGLGQINAGVLWPPFLGGLIWSAGAFCAFSATAKIGIAKAFGIWAPLNIIVSIFWGAVLFDEFVDTSPFNLLWLIFSVLVILLGVLMIIFAKGGGEKIRDQKTMVIGLAGAVGAGILWGTYFIPIKISSASMWVAAFPLAIGIFVGSAIMALLSRQPFVLERNSHYLRVGLTGILWGIGNYGSLLLIETLGAGKGFTIAQLSIVVNALVGIYILKDPRPRTRAAAFTLTGCVLATMGAVILGNI